MRPKTFILAVSLACLVPHTMPAQEATPAPPPGPGQAAVAAAAREGRYVFVLFHKEDDTATKAVRQTLGSALATRQKEATSVAIRVDDPSEKRLVDQYGVTRSPMPLVLAVAPNGAVTRGFPLKLSEKDVASAFVSPGQAACMKAVQARKLVLLCVFPAAGKAELPAGVSELRVDQVYGPATEVVSLRASDRAEAGFFKALQLSATPDTPVTLLFAPPGRMLGSFSGAVTRQQLVDRIQSPQGCCPGGKCGPGGCCQKK